MLELELELELENKRSYNGGDMTIEQNLESLAERGDDRSLWKPALYTISNDTGREALAELVNAGSVARVHDELHDQLGELVSTRSPQRKLKGPELDERIASHLAGAAAFEYGTWVFYPWSRRLVHVLPEPEFRELRSSRNRYKIAVDEQRRLDGCKIGVVGLSVGLASAITLALEGVGRHFRLADFDQLALSNMNRLSTSLYHLGVNKAVIAARELFELDPYISIDLFPNGLSESTVEEFLTGGGPLDLVIEECDDLYMKVLVRERAKAHRIPVIMDTNDRGMLDIERFDIEPERPVLHGLLDQVSSADIKGLATSKEKVPFLLRILGADTLSTRSVASLFEIEQSLSSWPQLASGVMLGGALTTDIARRILLNQLRVSGRFYIDMEDLVRDDAAVKISVDRSIDDVLSRKPEPLHVPPLTPVAAGATISSDDVRAIVAYGTLAPSAGNVQPWKFTFGRGRLRCRIDEERAWVFLDFKKTASHVALGAAVENIRIASEAKGIRADVRPFPDPSDSSVMCDIELMPADAPIEPSPLAPHLAKRMTNRRRTRRVPIAQSAIEALIEAARAKGGRLLLLTTPEDLDEAAKLVGGIDRLMYLSERMHSELTREVRWTQRDVEVTRDGVDVATLELSQADLAGMRLAMSWRGMEYLRAIGGGRGLEKLSREMIEGASAVGVVVFPGGGLDSYFAGGQALQRVWLTASAEGLAVHPMSAILYLFARLERGQGEGLSETEIRTLRELRERYLKLFQVKPDEAEVFLFRLGHADPPLIRSLRRPVEDVLTFEQNAGPKKGAVAGARTTSKSVRKAGSKPKRK